MKSPNTWQSFKHYNYPKRVYHISISFAPFEINCYPSKSGKTYSYWINSQENITTYATKHKHYKSLKDCQLAALAELSSILESLRQTVSTFRSENV